MIVFLLGPSEVGDQKISAWIRKLSQSNVVTVSILDENLRDAAAPLAIVGKQARLLGRRLAVLQKCGACGPNMKGKAPMDGAPVHIADGNEQRAEAVPVEDEKEAVHKSNGTRVVNGAAAKSLSGRQADVATLVSRGLSNKQIGRELGMSDNTVRVHLKKIFRCLKVTNRTQAAMWVRSASAHSVAKDF